MTIGASNAKEDGPHIRGGDENAYLTNFLIAILSKFFV